MAQPLDGVNEKIKRANECICNLDREINTFFDQSDYPIIPDHDDKMFHVVYEYHVKRAIPLRFSVLAGEVIHHLRSCFDHLIWQLSNSLKQFRDPTGIEFPVFDIKPVRKDELSRYERKVAGVSAPAKTLIQRLQPYNLSHPKHSPLFIIHEMDRLDKHRELVIVVPVLGSRRSIDALRTFMKYKQAENNGLPIEFNRAVEMDTKTTPHVTFREFGGRKYEPVVPGLHELVGYTEIVIEDFGRFFK
jgi:hypothetical protein